MEGQFGAPKRRCWATYLIDNLINKPVGNDRDILVYPTGVRQPKATEILRLLETFNVVKFVKRVSRRIFEKRGVNTTGEENGVCVNN